MEYPDSVLARFDAPPHAGPLASGSGTVVTGRAGGVAEGIEAVFQVRVADGRIVAAAFYAYGCPYSIAACSLTAERLMGLEVNALRDFAPLSLAPELELPVEKRGRLLRIEDALRSCWRAWDNRGLAASKESRSDP